MKHSIFYHILCISCIIALSLQARAQKDSISTELNKTIRVVSDYKPQISDAVRLSTNPKAYDTLDLRVELHYSIESAPIATAYTLSPLKAVSVKGDKLPELYRGYAAVGFGNYNTSFANIRYMSERSRNIQTGVEYYHLSSAGKIRFEDDNKYAAGYTQEYFHIYGKKFYEKAIVRAAITPSYFNTLKYGHQLFDSTLVLLMPSDSLFAKKDIRKHIFTNTTQAGIESTSTDKKTFRYTSTFQHDITIVNPKTNENLLHLTTAAKKQFGQIQTGLKLNSSWSAINFVSTDSLGKHAILLNMLPHVGTTVDNWSLQIGINAFQLWGENMFRVYPDVQFDYNALSYTLIPYVRYNGKLEHISLKQMLAENPYTSDFTMLKAKNQKMNLQIGTRGRFLRSIPFNVYVKYSEIENMHFWVNDVAETQGMQNSFKAVYDNTSILNLHAEAGIKRKVFDLNGHINYYHYKLESFDYAWHKPSFDAQIDLKYAIINPLTSRNKLVVFSQLFFENGMYAQTIDNNSYKLPTIFDVNLGFEYYYSSVFVIFANINNITGSKYQRYYLYPTQRTNFLVGLTYSFSGLKQ